MTIIPVKVLHIASGDLWAGAEVQLYTLAKTLQAEPDIDINLVLLNHGRLEEECIQSGLSVTVLDETRLSSMQIFRGLIRTIKDIGPDIVHTHRFKENILGSIAARLASVKTSIRTVHGAPEHRPPWWKLPKRMLFSLESICGRYLQDKVVAVSSDLANILRKQFPGSRVCIIENGIEPGDFQPVQNEASGRNSKPSVYEIGIAGRLVPIKRIDLYIHAAQQFLDTCPDMPARFHIYGDGPLREKLQSLSKTLGMEKHIMFEGHCDAMNNALQELDVLLMTSDHEGLPMILLEAMALQVPIIAHATGGIPALLDNGTCGILVQDQDSACYADAIRELLSSNEKRQQLIANASRQIESRYSANQNAAAYTALYRKITVAH